MTDHLITLDCGPINGKREIVDGFSVDYFLGVPFAKPPIGELRFEKPQPPSPWTSPINCHSQPPLAFPIVFNPSDQQFSEDCLYLNIYRPSNIPKDELLPVFFMIHGGGFEFGSAARYANLKENVKKYVSKGIILVAIQYRLGVLGFAAENSSHFAGNLGLYDQTEALKFIHRNAKSIGADSNRIIAYGYSAGSVSVSALMVSPLTRDYISAGIALAGSPLAAWGCSDMVLDKSKDLGIALGQKEEETLKEVLKRSSMKEILETTKNIGTSRENQNFVAFGPRIDGHFLPKSIPELIAESPKKPLFVGMNEQECLLFTLINSQRDALNQMCISPGDYANFGKKDVEKILKEKLILKENFCQNHDEILEKFIQFYSNLEEKKENEPGSVFYQRMYTQIFSDLTFNIPILNETWLKLLQDWPIYAYKFDHFNKGHFRQDVKIHQAYHGLDQRYVIQGFGFDQPNFFDDTDRKVEKFLVDSIVNFIKTNDPSSESLKWPKTSLSDPFQHVVISGTPRISSDFFLNRIEFYNNITANNNYDIVSMTNNDRKKYQAMFQAEKFFKTLKNLRKCYGKI